MKTIEKNIPHGDTAQEVRYNLYFSHSAEEVIYTNTEIIATAILVNISPLKISIVNLGNFLNTLEGAHHH